MYKHLLAVVMLAGLVCYGVDGVSGENGGVGNGYMGVVLV